MTGMKKIAQPVCPKCHGAKHVLVGGRWSRCSCVVARVRGIALEIVGVPAAFHTRPMKLPAWVSTPICAGPKPELYWVRGPTLGERRTAAWAAFLCAAVDQGLTAAKLADFSSIDARFDKDEFKAWRETVRHTDALVFELRSAGHKLLPQVVEEVVAVRGNARAATLFVSADDPRVLTGRYGGEFPRWFRTTFARPHLDTTQGARRV